MFYAGQFLSYRRGSWDGEAKIENSSSALSSFLSFLNSFLVLGMYIVLHSC